MGVIYSRFETAVDGRVPCGVDGLRKVVRVICHISALLKYDQRPRCLQYFVI